MNNRFLRNMAESNNDSACNSSDKKWNSDGFSFMLDLLSEKTDGPLESETKVESPDKTIIPLTGANGFSNKSLAFTGLQTKIKDCIDANGSCKGNIEGMDSENYHNSIIVNKNAEDKEEDGSKWTFVECKELPSDEKTSTHLPGPLVVGVVNNPENGPLQNYRGDSDTSSDDDSSSTISRDSSSSSCDAFFDKMQKNTAPRKPITVKTKGELDLDELPPIEELHITLTEKEMEKIGTIYAVVEQLVVVRAIKGLKPLDLESVLFLSPEKILGRIFDVFGPVVEPFYSVRFNSVQQITDKVVPTDADVFYAPYKKEITSYVFVDQLTQQKGSDASWKDNNEPPDEFLDYSDDEQERAAKQKRRAKTRNYRNQDDEVQIVPNKISASHRNNVNRPWRNSQNSTYGSPRPHSSSSYPSEINPFRAPTHQPFVRTSTASSTYAKPSISDVMTSKYTPSGTYSGPSPFLSPASATFTRPGPVTLAQSASVGNLQPYLPQQQTNIPFSTPYSFQNQQPFITFSQPSIVSCPPPMYISPQAYINAAVQQQAAAQQAAAQSRFLFMARPSMVPQFAPQAVSKPVMSLEQPTHVFGKLPALGTMPPGYPPPVLSPAAALMGVPYHAGGYFNQNFSAPSPTVAMSALASSTWPQSSPISVQPPSTQLVPPNAPLSVHIPASISMRTPPPHAPVSNSYFLPSPQFNGMNVPQNFPHSR